MSNQANAIRSDLNQVKKHAQDASSDVSKEFKNFLSDVENLFKDTASLSGDDLAKVKAKLNQRIEAAKEYVGESSASIGQQVRKTAASTNQYVHEQPWTVIGAGAAISFLVGFLLARRN